MKDNIGWKIKRRPSKKIVHSRVFSKADKHSLSIQEKSTFVYEADIKITTFPGGDFHAFSPDPIDLLIECARSQINKAIEIQGEFNKNRRFENSKELTQRQTELFDELTLNLFFIPVILHSALEAFANRQIFDHKDFLHSGWKKNNKGEYYDIYGIQRWLSLEEKFLKVVPRVTHKKIDDSKDETRNLIQEITKIRNLVVHQKVSDEERNASILIKDILSKDWLLLLRNTERVMEKYKGYFDGITVEDKTKKKAP